MHFRTILKLVFFIAVTAATLNQFALLIAHLLTIDYDWKFELAMVIGQVLFQMIFLWKHSVAEKITYTEALLTVSFIGSILLLPIIVLNHYYPQTDIINLVYFFGVVSIMFLIHWSKVHRLRLPWWLCFTWVLYRLIILVFIADIF